MGPRTELDGCGKLRPLLGFDPRTVQRVASRYTDYAIPTDTEISYLLTNLFTYLLTPWSRVLLGKLTGFQLVKKFPEFYGTRRFITAVTSTRHPSLS